MYYRINVVDFTLLPLRDRRVDIPLLVNHFLEVYNKRYNKKIRAFDKASMNIFISYSWPGNVRELSNTVNQAFLLNDGEIISLRGFKKNVLHEKNDLNVFRDFSSVKSLKEKIGEIKEHYEKMIIKEYLNKNSNNKSKTARELAVTRKTLSQKISKYGL